MAAQGFFHEAVLGDRQRFPSDAPGDLRRQIGAQETLRPVFYGFSTNLSLEIQQASLVQPMQRQFLPKYRNAASLDGVI
jgi:hypothetical protein